MPATDYFQKVGWSTATTLSAPGYTTGATSINVGSTTNWPTTTGVTFAIDTIDSAGLRVSGSYNVFRGTVSSATLIDNITYVGGDANQNYSAGSTTRVYILVSSYRDNRFTDGILVEHEQDGTHAVELITSRTEDTNPDPDADFLLTYDTSASALKKVKPSNLSGGLTGWTSNVLPSVSSVTNEGNRSYTVSFGSSIASYLSPGMRIRATRTVTAPTQCADLEAGSSQYFNDTSVSGMTFTDDFVVSAWIKVESYAAMAIAGRYSSATASGYTLDLTASGQVRLVGFNAGGGNYSLVQSYQSVPLNKWVHVAAQLDMSTFTATTTTSYVMIDGVDVPASVSRAGTNPTAIVQSGNLDIGVSSSANSPSSYFDGKIAQVAIYSAKVTQANIRATISQGLSGSETSLVSAYSFNNSINDLNANANNLTAQGGALATNADSPFSIDANGVTGSYDYAIVTKVATTTATVQVPEGCTIPTSGGVSAVDLSSVKSPFGFPAQRGRWSIQTLIKAAVTLGVTGGTWYGGSALSITIPVGSWSGGYSLLHNTTRTTTADYRDTSSTLSTSSSTETDVIWTDLFQVGIISSTVTLTVPHYRTGYIDVTTATPYYGLVKEASTTTTTSSIVAGTMINFEPSYL